jgi:hypothetical protein
LHTLTAQTATSLVIAQPARQNWLWLEIRCGRATLSVCIQSRDNVSKQSLDSRDTLSRDLYPSVY